MCIQRTFWRKRQKFAAFRAKTLKLRPGLPNQSSDPPKLVGPVGLSIVSSVSGGALIKDRTMSNDINPSRLPPAVTSTPVTKPAEAVRAPAPETAQPVAEAKPQHDPQETRRTLEEATEHLNQQMRRNSRDLSFSVDDVANKVVLTVKNKEGEVVRQIPNEVALRVAHNLDNMKGLMQDAKS
jgi:flagellar protein FlaG